MLNKHHQQPTMKLHRMVNGCNGCINGFWVHLDLACACKEQVRVCFAELHTSKVSLQWQFDNAWRSKALRMGVDLHQADEQLHASESGRCVCRTSWA